MHFRNTLLCLRLASADAVSWGLLLRSALAAHHPRVQPEVKPRLWRAFTQQISAAIPSTLSGALSLSQVPKIGQLQAVIQLDGQASLCSSCR